MNKSNSDITHNEAAATTVFIADADLRIVRVNNASVDSTGVSGSQILSSLDLLDHIEGIDREEARRICETILSGGRFAGGARSYRKVVAVLGERSVLLLGPHFVSTDRVGGVVYAKFRSTHGDGVVQRELEPENFYEYLVERSTDLVFLTDESGFITFANKSIEWFTNITADAIRGRHVSEIIHPDDVDRFRAALVTAASFQGPLPELQCRIVSTDGTIRTAIFTANLLETANGPRILGVCRDVTESVELRETLLIRNRALSTINDIVIALSSARLLAEGLKRTLEMILDAVGIDRGFITLINRDDPTAARVRYYINVDIEGFVNKSRTKFYEDGQPLTITRIEDCQHFDDSAKTFLLSRGIEAMILVPLTNAGAVIQPVLFLVVPADYELTPQQREFLKLAGGIIGPAIENARLYEVERTKSLELEALAREAHHRIKNNLQMITGLLNISGNESGNNWSAALTRCKRQIKAVATVHDLLTPKSKASELELLHCIANVAEHALMGMGCADRIRLTITGDEHKVTPDSATALGIVANEIVCNAAEHAFKNQDCGSISIDIDTSGARTVLTIEDDGAGLAKDFVVPQSPDCGLGLVRSLVAYGLGGDVSVEDTGNGTKVAVIF